MYEACALGTPIVAVPVVDAQRPAIDAAARRGAVMAAAGHGAPVSAARVATAVERLLVKPALAEAQGAIAARQVDGQGMKRFVLRLTELLDVFEGGTRHAA